MALLLLLLLAFGPAGQVDGRIPVSRAVARGTPPRWQPTYDMRRSTIAMPCNDSGFMAAATFADYGIVSYDWSNAKQIWWGADPRPARLLLPRMPDALAESAVRAAQHVAAGVGAQQPAASRLGLPCAT